MENWKPIKGYEDRYEISDHGRVKRLSLSIVRKDGKPLHLKEKFLKPNYMRKGVPYLYVSLTKKGKLKTFYIHRLVLESFDPFREKDLIVLHKDGNPKNNFLYNLRWGTHKQNGEDMRNHGNSLKGTKNSRAVLKDEQVLRIRELREQGKTIKELANLFKVGKTTIGHIIHGRTWKHLLPTREQ